MKKVIVIIFLYLFFQSCIDCNRSAKYIYDEKFNLVIEIPPSSYPDPFKTKGYDPITKEVKTYTDGNRWLDFYKNDIEEGDTIVKRQGEMVFNIHKKDTVIVNVWVCYDGNGRHTHPNK